MGALCQADAVVLTHYHDDHVNLLSYVLSSTALYLKRPVTPSENRCAQDLFPRLQRTGRPFTLADKNTVGMRDVSLSFSGAAAPRQARRQSRRGDGRGSALQGGLLCPTDRTCKGHLRRQHKRGCCNSVRTIST